jgi:hypothetical protein
MLAAFVLVSCVAVAVAGPQQVTKNPQVIQAAKAEADLAGATWPGAVPTDVLFNLTNNNGNGKGGNNGNICNGPDGVQALELSRGCSAYILCCKHATRCPTSAAVWLRDGAVLQGSAMRGWRGATPCSCPCMWNTPAGSGIPFMRQCYASNPNEPVQVG